MGLLLRLLLRNSSRVLDVDGGLLLRDVALLADLALGELSTGGARGLVIRVKLADRERARSEGTRVGGGRLRVRPLRICDAPLTEELAPVAPEWTEEEWVLERLRDLLRRCSLGSSAVVVVTVAMGKLPSEAARELVRPRDRERCSGFDC